MTTDLVDVAADDGLRVCGVAGADGRERAGRMAEHMGGVAPVANGPSLAVFGSSMVTARSGAADDVVRWTTTGSADVLHDDWRVAAYSDDASGVVASVDGTVLVHGSLSGAAPVYVEVGDRAVAFSTSIDALAATVSASLRPDWDAWADTIIIGAPLRNRTPFRSIRRVPPWSVVGAGSTIGECPPSDWPWFAETRAGAATIDDLLLALRAVIARLASRGASLASLLSGGWDSRVLLAIAADGVGTDRLTAWTTSSDIGTVLDELVACEVADLLGVDHRIVVPQTTRIADDITTYARAVDFQSSFHVWLMPFVARLWAHGSSCVLDGLGGGIFLDAAFGPEQPDDGGTVEAGRQASDERFRRLARYANQLGHVLRPDVVSELVERARSSFDAVVGQIAARAPGRHDLEAYLVRTAPGIALGPAALLAGRGPVATPFLDGAVVEAASGLPASLRRGGEAYRALLRAVRSDLAELATATELTGARRAHRRRIASFEAASWYRELLTTSPVSVVLNPELLTAEVADWQSLLDRTGTQHAVRSLGSLALWLRQYPALDLGSAGLLGVGR